MAGSATVVDAADLIPTEWFFAATCGKALKIKRGTTPSATIVDCIPEGGPYSKGTIWVHYTATTDHLGEVPELLVELLSSTDQILGRLTVGGAKFKAEGTTPVTLSKSYSASEAYEVLMVVDLEQANFAVLVQENGGGATGYSDLLDWVDNTATDFDKLRFTYPGAVLEAIPGRTIIDDITIRRVVPEDAPLLVTPVIIPGASFGDSWTESLGYSMSSVDDFHKDTLCCVENGHLLVGDPGHRTGGMTHSGVVWTCTVSPQGEFLGAEINRPHFESIFGIPLNNNKAFQDRKYGSGVSALPEPEPGVHVHGTFNFLALSLKDPGHLFRAKHINETSTVEFSWTELPRVPLSHHDLTSFPWGDNDGRIAVVGDDRIYYSNQQVRTGGLYLARFYDQSIDVNPPLPNLNFGGTLDEYDFFGHSLDEIGDVNGDGTVDLAVGAPGDDDLGPDSGAVWILLMNKDGTAKPDLIKLTREGANNFGSAVAGIGDLDGDGCLDLAVRDDDGVHLLYLNCSSVVGEPSVVTIKSEQTIEPPPGIKAFRHDLASMGDIDGDGPLTLALAVGGETFEEGNGEDEGNNKWAVVLLLLQKDPLAQ